jgi:hypothetical protein
MERVIKSVQESCMKALQTLAKLMEKSYNSIPLGYHQHERAGGTPVLKMICPNHLISDMYAGWFENWQDVYVPQLLYKPNWFCSNKDLLDGDLVYFKKKEGKLSIKWTIGMVDSVLKGRDGILREVTIKYCNSSEQCMRLTDDSSKDKTLPR